MLNEKTTAIAETTTTTANPVMTAFEAHCRKVLDEAPARMTAMVRELSDIAEAAGEVGNIDLMDQAMEIRAAIIRVIEVPAATERELSAAWSALGADAAGRAIRRAIGAALANAAALYRADNVPGSLMFDGGHEAVTRYGGRESLDPVTIAKAAERRAKTGKAKHTRKTGGRK